MTQETTLPPKKSSLFIWLGALAGDYLLLAAAFLLFDRFRWPALPFTLLLLGIAQHRIAILGHEGAHHLVCRSRRLNDLLSQVFCFAPLLTDLGAYRDFHWKHHRNTGIEGLDPELDLKLDRYRVPVTARRLYGRFLLDLCGASVAEFVEVVVYFSRRSSPFWPAAFLVVSATAAVAAGKLDWFVLFLVSKPTAFWAVFRLRVYMEHVGTDSTHRVRLNFFQRFLFAPHNTWLHWEHHEHPAVPFWQLPVLREQRRDIPVIRFSDVLDGRRMAAATLSPGRGRGPVVPSVKGVEKSGAMERKDR
jgi:fatty acid desaturase